ncbi:hypothetical protein SAMN05421823_110263 [Catalinimonas alkaloidigena]|uniref:Uncharacterized protein n=1 Tax=Catalinimonas alkaloidigena TaxID=1075417 RepID=A0A1G9QRY1_9BACT|nr:hypothetical protein SAMN05421823_110263 [Catalinimonas alkaloidigena]
MGALATFPLAGPLVKSGSVSTFSVIHTNFF